MSGGGNATNPREPLFILAPPRSCSTVTVALLSGHPGVYGFPELQIFAADTVGDLLRGDYTYRDDYLPGGWKMAELTGVLRALAEVHGGDQGDAAIGHGRAWLAERSHWSMTRLLDYLLDAVAPSVGLEKSPVTVTKKGLLERCFAAYPRARFLHLTRHPVTSMTSMREQFQSLAPERFLPMACLVTWYNAHLRVVEGLSTLPADRWLRIRAEDLLADPRAQLPPILDWLGLASDPATIQRMRRTQEWRFAGPGPGGGLGGGDAKFHSDPKLRRLPDPGPVAFDASWNFEEGALDRVVRLAAFLGYR